MLALGLFLALSALGAPDALDAPALKGAIVGAVVTTEDGQVIYERNADLRLMPASNQKLFTCLYAMDRFGPDYVPRTRIWKLPNYVVVDAPGDPSLNYQALAEAREQLKIEDGISIRVHQAFKPYIPPSWETDDLLYGYAGKVVAFSFDKATFPIVSVDGKIEPIRKEFDIRVKRGDTTGQIKVKYDEQKKLVTVDGALPAGRKVLETFAQPEPDKAAAAALGGIYMDDLGPLPIGQPDAVIEGVPLKDTIKACLVRSDNGYAERLLLMTASKDSPLGESPYDEATKRLAAFLRTEMGLEDTDVHPFDGSGLSRHNLATARSISKILIWAQRRPYFKAFRGCLAGPGDGTLSTRLQDLEFGGKTGTLDNVTSLSGYLTTKSGRKLIVSVIVNHTVAQPALVRQAIDEFVRSISEDNGPGTVLAPVDWHACRTSNSGTDIASTNWVRGLNCDRLASRTWLNN